MAECCSGLSSGSWWPSFVLVGDNAPWSRNTTVPCLQAQLGSSGLAALVWPFWGVSFLFLSCW